MVVPSDDESLTLQFHSLHKIIHHSHIPQTLFRCALLFLRSKQQFIVDQGSSLQAFSVANVMRERFQAL